MSGKHLQPSTPEGKVTLRSTIEDQVTEYLRSGGRIREYASDVFGQPYCAKRLTREQNIAKMRKRNRIVVR